MEAFNSLERMVVVGERVDSQYQALDIKLAVGTAGEGSESVGFGSK